MISNWIKENAVALIIGGAFGIMAGAVVGIIARPFIIPPSSVIVIQTNGENHGGQYIPPPIESVGTNCQWAIDRGNAIRALYIDFLKAPPIVRTVTPKRIDFTILSNRYSLSYSIEDVPRWHFAPIVAAAWTDSGFGYGAGAAVDYGNLGMLGMLILTLPYTPKAGILAAYVRF